ncbi:MAG: hypothetical protein K8S62_02825 [Candidatus Sabulitectum sp.]|nr:hypothetical protein [Candidatus Sabulitectum sp.]
MRITSGGVAIVILIAAAGCLDFGDDIETNNLTDEQIAYCQTIMHLNDQLQYDPNGLKILGSGIDDAVWFCFHTEETDPAFIFDTTFVSLDSLSGSVSIYSPEDIPDWWDSQEKELVGGVVPLQWGRFMTVGMERKESGTTVYIFWHET